MILHSDINVGSSTVFTDIDVVHCIVLFQQLPYIISNGCCAWPHGQCVCVCMYVVDSPKRQGEAMNTGDNPLALFDKCHGLFYMSTGTRDRRLNVPSEGQLMVHWCSVRQWNEWFTGSRLRL